MYVTGVIIAFCISFIVLMYQSLARIRNGEETFIHGVLVSLIASFVFSLLSWLTVFLFPYVYLKKRKRDNASKLFTDQEKLLLYKSQRVIEINNRGGKQLGKDIFTVAQLIEESRVEYQIMNEANHEEISFLEFLLPRVELLKTQITDWESANSYFEIQ